MSQENVEIVRRLYEAFNRRDLMGELEALDPEFEWIPDARSFESAIRGRENVLRFLEDQIETLDLRVQPEEFFEKGDRVIAFVRASGRGAASGAEFDISIAGVWTFQDGVPVRAQAYAERDKALEAVGLSE
jgi:ketosteroid isomerase-like protein